MDQCGPFCRWNAKFKTGYEHLKNAARQGPSATSLD